MKRLGSFCTRFCLAAGGLAALPVTHLSLVSTVLLAALALAFFFGCEALYRFRPFSPPRAVAVTHAALGSALSVFVAARLVTASGVLDRGFYPLMLTVTAALAVFASVKKGDGVTRVCIITAILSAVILLTVLLLSLIRSGVSPPHPGKPQPVLIFALFALSVSDCVLCPRGAAGGAAAHLYALATALVCTCVLGGALFEESAYPWLTLWSSTYIPTFLNSFEATAVCAFYALAAAKACVLFSAVRPKDPAPVLVLVILLILFSLSDAAVFIALALCVLCGASAPFFRKRSNE